jgi:hypothetical protein
MDNTGQSHIFSVQDSNSRTLQRLPLRPGVTTDLTTGNLTICPTAEDLLKHIRARRQELGPLCDEHFENGQVVISFSSCPSNAACAAAQVLDVWLPDGDRCSSGYVYAAQWLPLKTITVLGLSRDEATKSLVLTSIRLRGPWSHIEMSKGSLTRWWRESSEADAVEIVNLIRTIWENHRSYPFNNLAESRLEVVSAVHDVTTMMLPPDARLLRRDEQQLIHDARLDTTSRPGDSPDDTYGRFQPSWNTPAGAGSGRYSDQSRIASLLKTPGWGGNERLYSLLTYDESFLMSQGSCEAMQSRRPGMAIKLSALH